MAKNILRQADGILDGKGTRIAKKHKIFEGDVPFGGIGFQHEETWKYDGFGFAEKELEAECKEKNCKHLAVVPAFDGSVYSYNCTHPDAMMVVEIGGMQGCPQSPFWQTLVSLKQRIAQTMKRQTGNEMFPMLLL